MAQMKASQALVKELANWQVDHAYWYSGRFAD